MSLFEFKLPDIGEGVMEGEIVSWLVTQGQDVREDDPMVEVMTDKATVTIGAPKTGTVQQLLAEVGEVVEVGAVIVTLDTNGAGSASSDAASSDAAGSDAPSSDAASPDAASPDAASPDAAGASATSSSGAEARPAPAAPPAEPAPSPKASLEHTPAPSSARLDHDEGPAATAVGDIRDSLPGTQGFGERAAPVDDRTRAARGHFDPKPLATPATRKLARDLDVDLRRVPGSGPGGRVTKDDVRTYADGAQAEAQDAAPTAVGAPAPRAPRAGAREAAPIAITPPPAEHAALEERKPFVGVRRKIAERMQRTKNTAAHFTFVEECDVGRLKALRARLKPQAEAAGVKLSFLPFLVKAAVAALKKTPVLNAALDESTNELVYRRYYHIGIAAATDQGLMVPVVKDADRKSILEIAADIERLATEAREGNLARDELSGSTFTITSLGKTGGLFATPILNMPEVGILGVHQIKQRPVVRDGAIEIGEVMLLSLSFDHRIVDGHVGAAFAYDIIGYLEDPDRLFLEMA